MARIVKRKRKFKFNALINALFVFSFIGYVASATFLKSYNMNMNYELSATMSDIEEQKKKLETLRLDVAKYTEREYLMSISNEDGSQLKLDQQRIVYIANDDE